MYREKQDSLTGCIVCVCVCVCVCVQGSKERHCKEVGQTREKNAESHCGVDLLVVCVGLM